MWHVPLKRNKGRIAQYANPAFVDAETLFKA